MKKFLCMLMLAVLLTSICCSASAAPSKYAETPDAKKTSLLMTVATNITTMLQSGYSVKDILLATIDDVRNDSESWLDAFIPDGLEVKEKIIEATNRGKAVLSQGEATVASVIDLLNYMEESDLLNQVGTLANDLCDQAGTLVKYFMEELFGGKKADGEADTKAAVITSEEAGDEVTEEVAAEEAPETDTPVTEEPAAEPADEAAGA